MDGADPFSPINPRRPTSTLSQLCFCKVLENSVFQLPSPLTPDSFCGKLSAPSYQTVVSERHTSSLKKPKYWIGEGGGGDSLLWSAPVKNTGLGGCRLHLGRCEGLIISSKPVCEQGKHPWLLHCFPFREAISCTASLTQGFH